MKLTKSILALATAITISGSAFAQTVTFPTNPVIGVLGASFSTCQAPKNSPLAGVGLAGCSYEGIYESLIKDNKIVKNDYRVETTALGGGYSYDVPQTGWTGLATQYADMKARTSWFDGIQRLKAIVISTVNDCLHTNPCTRAEMESVLIQNTQNVINTALSQNVDVYVVGYPEWSDLNFTLAAQVYGLTNTIGQADYNYLKTKYKNVISAIPGVVFLNSWKNNFSSFDGLHPSAQNTRKTAKEIGKLVTQ